MPHRQHRCHNEWGDVPRDKVGILGLVVDEVLRARVILELLAVQDGTQPVLQLLVSTIHGMR
jgi:hypothetical protein